MNHTELHCYLFCGLYCQAHYLKDNMLAHRYMLNGKWRPWKIGKIID